MIIKTYINKNLYGKYFLATEAPDDEEVTEEQPKPRRNVKVISVKPSNRGKDFSEIDEEPPVEDAPAETPEETEPTEPVEEPTEEVQPTEEITPDNPENMEDGPDLGGDEDFTADDGTGEEQPVENTTDEEPTEEIQPTEEDTPDNPENMEDGPDLGGDEDFTADDGTGEEQPVENTTEPAQTTDNNAPGVDLDSMRKYNLFKEFMSLYNACDNYISKLENVLKNDYEENQIIRISVNNLREIRDILSDYMTIRFRLNSYVQSLLFHQKMVVAVQLIFNLLKSINSKSK